MNTVSQSKQPPQYIRVPDAAPLLGLSAATLYRLIERRAVPFYRFSPRGIFLDRAELQAWAEMKRHGATDEG